MNIHPPLPNPYTLLASVLETNACFTVLDLKDAFFCIPVDEQSQTIIAFEWENPVMRRKVIESLRLEKTSNIMKSNRQPSTTVPIKPCPEVPCLHVFQTPPGMLAPPLPWAACSNS